MKSKIVKKKQTKKPSYNSLAEDFDKLKKLYGRTVEENVRFLIRIKELEGTVKTNKIKKVRSK